MKFFGVVGLGLLLGTFALASPTSAAAPRDQAMPLDRAVAKAGVEAIVRAPGGLNVRSGAATDRSILGTVDDGSRVRVVCQVWGQQVKGTQRTAALWDRLDWGHGHVADGFLQWPSGRPALPWCGDPPVDATSSAVDITSGSLNVRSGPSTKHSTVGSLGDAAGLRVECRSWGSTVDGNAVWDRIGPGRYVADKYVHWAPTTPRYPWCGQAPATVPAATKDGFLARVAGAAQASARTWKVPASVTIAQAILESGWGRSTLTRVDHSYFGMKCFGGPGPIAVGCSTYVTQECSNGKCRSTRASFRAYRATGDSFDDHGRQLATLPRYQTAMKYTNDPERFAREIHKAGYATSPTYANNLIDLMRRFDLTKYDRRS
ncbi:flagellar protein FlgJ [Hamadaea flava]|uniref:Sporangiospore maturation cell wall hydrolase GsmA n=1 Tax=Hamadaea flava TaxID=1742688 RepID=A0ABV8LSS0_9ACTN|nr:sporangiospore maturation cell wall hydrolase GsmA [Hamadaea flava]MCP2328079.1 flagellar protein FlgJ [Hamadaea flava]